MDDQLCPSDAQASPAFFRPFALIFAASALSLSLGLGAAQAADSGSSDSSDSGGSGELQCREGMVYDPVAKICVDEDEQADGSEGDDDSEARLHRDRELYDQGRELALAGRYGEALDAFEAISETQNANILTMMGFATRKSGAIDEGIALYHQALAIEPDNLNTLEYLGEGYLASGDLPLAVEQLHRLKQLCGADCDQYRQLAAAISGTANWQ